MSSMFPSILNALGLGKEEKSAPAEKPKPTAASARATDPGRRDIPTPKKEMEMVDVEALMEAKAKANPEKLDWKVSIVDLLKLLDIESDLQHRKELASELGAPLDLFDDSAKMNVWLHKKVLQKIAENGGNVPKNLLD
jgi:hypothetical protein